MSISKDFDEENNDKMNKLIAENEIILDRLTQYEEDADVQVCLFSDVKRLEQENAELKTDNKHLNDLLDNALKEQEELRSENERLKAENILLLSQLVINDGEDVTVQEVE